MNQRSWLSAMIVALGIAVPLLAGCATTQPRDDTDCARYVVLPPAHDDEIAADALLSTWTKAVTPTLPECSAIVDAATAKALFRRLDISQIRHNTQDTLDRSQIEQIRDKLQATHIVFLRYRIRGPKVRLLANVFSLNPWQRDPAPGPEGGVLADLPASSPVRETPSFRLLAHVITLLPNAFQFGYASTDFENANSSKGVVTEGYSDRYLLPPIVSALSIGRLIHPDRFLLWDWDVGFVTQLGFTFINRNYSLYTLDANGNISADTYVPETLQVKMLMPNIGVALRVHTPIGTSYGELAGGPGFFAVSDRLTSTTGITFVTRVSIGHYVFLSERFFVKAAFDYYQTSFPVIDDQDFRISVATDATLGLGYFLPEAPSAIRRLFGTGE